MPDIPNDLTHLVFAKTTIGQQEIQTRSLGLPAMQRRLLILVDGKRSGKELAAFVAGHDVSALLDQLIAAACISALTPVAPMKLREADVSTTSKGMETVLAELPAPESRTEKDTEMARNFMVNTVNFVFGQNTRKVMLQSISACQTASDLRRVYPEWVNLLSSSQEGTKKLPEYRVMLFKVL
jgi:hypothetical protein